VGITLNTKTEMQIEAIGQFYVVRILPVIKPDRLKLGYSTDAKRRLRSYRTIAPFAELLAVYGCKRSWEAIAISVITARCCEHIKGEVYDCNNLQALLDRCEKFFSIMPSYN